MHAHGRFILLLLVSFCLSEMGLSIGISFCKADDQYRQYVLNAPEYHPVPWDPSTSKWESWVYMPWRYQWSIGTTEAGGEFCRDYGIRGAFTDHGSGPFEWINRYQLQFYNDHTAGKGDLYLRGANQKQLFASFQRDARVIRQDAEGNLKPLDAQMQQRLKKTITRQIEQIRRSSSQQIAYALDDEISWGAFVNPLPWRIHDDEEHYQNWLNEYYGRQDTPQASYITPDDLRPQYARKLEEIDFSPFLDRMTYNDSQWAIFLGQLIEAANQADPQTPCGFVGGQSPSLWGGYDYTKIMKQVQFIESYNLGSSCEIIRSFNQQRQIPVVATHFHKQGKSAAIDRWLAWYFFAHGHRGMIGWVENWFDDQGRPLPWLEEFRPTLQELSDLQGRKLNQSEWLHDGIAIYYSHPSIQVSWLLDSEAHGKTWVNRGNDDRLGTSHLTRQAWEYLLNDAGLQYNFLGYDEVLRTGIPSEYRVLILPACYAISDAEADEIRQFCARGGTVLADFGTGLFDQHGRGRSRGCLDDLFGISHTGSETKDDFFGPNLWVETNQDTAYSYKTYRDLFASEAVSLHQGFTIAEENLPVAAALKTGKGNAIYINLSPQRYLQYRQQGETTVSMRDLWLHSLKASGIEPVARARHLTDSAAKFPLELTRWRQGDRCYLFVIQNQPMSGGSLGGAGADGLVEQTVPIELEFKETVRDFRNERSATEHGDLQKIVLEMTVCEAVLVSYAVE